MAGLAGIIYLRIDGSLKRAKGNFTYGLGATKKEAIIGADGVHGFKETPTVAFIEGEITDDVSLDLENFFKITDATVQIDLRNGKSIILRNAWYAGDGTAQTEDANVKLKFEGLSAIEQGVSS